MKVSEEILNELREISPSLAKMDRSNPFSVPEDYFSTLSERMLINTKIYAEQADSSINSARVPEGYFDNLSSQILNKIKNQDISGEEFPLLSSLKDVNVFSVPEGYFENLSDQVLNKIACKPAKIISIKNWMKYAAAAVIAGVLAITGLQIYNGSNANHQVASNDKLPTYIQSSLQYKTPALKMRLKKVIV
jgi:2-iminoacetate synthase ThiH